MPARAASLRTNYRSIGTDINPGSIVAKLMGAPRLSDLQGVLKSENTLNLTVESAVALMRKCIELKSVNDTKFRGRIPREIVSIVSEAVVDHLDEMDSGSIVTLVVGASDCNKSADEYLLYRIARSLVPRISFFSTRELIGIVVAFCKRDLVDLELFEAVSTHLAIVNPGAPLPELIEMLRSFSRVSFKPQNIVDLIISRVSTERILGKDAISLLVAITELDVEDPILLDTLWAKVEKHKLILSHDDEYGLIFAFLRSKGSATVVSRIVDRASRENRINKRIQLLKDSISAGIVLCDIHFPIVPERDTKKHISQAVSSGLHLEVINALNSMGYQPVLEIPAGSFVLDTVIVQ